jgi:hypothetical protein
VSQRFGVNDLDAAGEWVQPDLGAAWKPKVADGWAPFQHGRWRWYDGLGYTWVSDEPWGWLPYHNGRWARKNDFGWVWVPSKSAVFKPGDVYWLTDAKSAGWGPLAPGEQWQLPQTPAQFQSAAVAYASFPQDARVIDPAGFMNGPQPGVAVFALALPSPAFVASRLDAVRPTLRVGSTRMDLVIPGTTFEDTSQAPPPPEAPPTNSDGDVAAAPPPDPGGSGGSGAPVMYPPPYTGIIVIDPQDRPSYGGRNNNVPIGRPVNPATTVPGPSTTTTPAQDPQRVSRPVPVVTPREPPRDLPHPVMAPSAPPPAPARVEAPRPETPHVQAPPPPPPPAKEVKVETKADAKPDPPAAKKQ